MAKWVHWQEQQGFFASPHFDGAELREASSVQRIGTPMTQASRQQDTPPQNASDNLGSGSSLSKDTTVSPRIIHLLEKLDDAAHVMVAGLLIVIAAFVLVYACLAFGQHIVAALFEPSAGPAGAHAAGQKAPDSFLLYSVEFLSSTLFVVIVLEILRTLLTYLQSRRIRDIAEDFLVVGILTIVRKILLVGANSSLSEETGAAFVQESWGTFISIGGVLLLIVGLASLRRVYPDNKGKL